MKKTNTLILLFFCSLSLLTGQNKWNFSPSVIIGYSGEKSNHESSGNDSQGGYFLSLDEKKILPTIGAGFTVERLLGSRFRINLGARYLYNQLFQQNEYYYYTSLDFLISYYETEKKLSSHQLQAPVQLHFYFGKPGNVRPYIGAGGQITYLISAITYSKSTHANTGEVGYSSSASEYDLKNEWSNFDRFNIAMNYAIGIEFNRFSIELNRTQTTLKQNGFVNFYDDCLRCYVASPKKKTQATTMSMKYKL